MDPQPDWVVIPYSECTWNAKEDLRELGCQPDKLNKRWLCPPEVAEQAQRLVELCGWDLEDLSAESQQRIKAVWAERAAAKVQPTSG